MANSTQIKIMQWNARSLISNKQSFEIYLNKYNIDVALICETWFKPGHSVNFKGYHIIRNDRADGKAGVAILIKKNLAYRTITLDQNFNTGINICGATILVGDKKVTFLSVYKPPNVNTSFSDWTNISSQILSPFIDAGDFNAHSPLWGSHKNNSTGTQISKLIDDFDYILLNTGDSTRVQRPGCNKSVVDLSFCSPDLASKALWSIESDTLGSDHFPINILLEYNNSNFSEIIHPKTKWNVNKSNWNGYYTYIDQMMLNTPNFIDINEKYDFLTECINTAANLFIPKFKPFLIKNKLPAPWWNAQDCDPMLLRRKEALKVYKQNPSMDNYLNCQKAQADTKKFFKSKARASWRNWCSNLNKNTPSTKIWSQARKMNRVTAYKKPENDGWINEFFDHITLPLFYPNLLTVLFL